MRSSARRATAARRSRWCRASSPTSCSSISACPEMDGIQAAQALAGAAHVVFVTAYDQYAVTRVRAGRGRLPAEAGRARATGADLPAPARAARSTSPTRWTTCWRSCRSVCGSGGVAAARIHALGTGQRGRQPPHDSRPATSCSSAPRTNTRACRPSSFEALIRKPIKELIDELDPEEFWQIHRATVVRVDAIEQVSRNFRGNQVVHVKGSAEKLEVSRTFNHLFKQM